MKNASHDILHTLSERGYRITDARRVLVNLLVNAAAPRTIQELTAASTHNESSVYRFITVLVDEGLVEEINAKGQKARYAPAFHHHHHAVCTSCGLVSHVPCVAAPVVPDDFSALTEVVDHEVTFYGRCRTCA